MLILDSSLNASMLNGFSCTHHTLASLYACIACIFHFESSQSATSLPRSTHIFHLAYNLAYTSFNFLAIFATIAHGIACILPSTIYAAVASGRNGLTINICPKPPDGGGHWWTCGLTIRIYNRDNLLIQRHQVRPPPSEMSNGVRMRT